LGVPNHKGKHQTFAGKFILSGRTQRFQDSGKVLKTSVIIVFCLAMVFLIIVFFFRGCAKRKTAETTPQMSADLSFWIRVLLLNDVNNIRLNFRSSWSINSNGEQSEHFQQPAEPVIINIESGRLSIGGRAAENPEISIEPDDPFIFSLNGADYRGNLRLVVNAGGSSFDAVNYVPLESYLAGVIGAEMPSYWEPAALEAQAIASRTYCLFMKRRFGVNRHWDVGRTEASQVYLGLMAESPQIWRTVNKTFGLVLMCSFPDGSSGIFPTYYSSSCGGHTEDSRNVFGGTAYEPLKGVPCPYCQEIAKPKDLFWPEVELDKNEVSERLMRRYPSLGNLETIVDISASKQSEYRFKSENVKPDIIRITQIKLTGANGNFDFLRAEDFRCCLDPEGRTIRSTIFKITSRDSYWIFYEGRGFGHGVGMCQCGAQAMARIEGKAVEQILFYYYPNSFIKYVY
jgi:stage II sporulation protein D